MGKPDYVGTLKDGIGLMGKMAMKGVDSISRGIRGDEGDENSVRESGIYFYRHMNPGFGELLPIIGLLEPVKSPALNAGILERFARSPADRSFLSAIFSVTGSQWDLALEGLQEALVADPRYSDSYFIQGAIHLQRRKFREAGEAFSKCRLLPADLGKRIRKFLPSFHLSLCLTDNISFVFYPDLVGLYILLSVSRRNSGDLNQAISTLEEVNSVLPDNPQVTLFLSALYFEAGMDDSMIEILKNLVPDDNLQLLNVQFLVMAFLRKGNYNLAGGILERALQAGRIDPFILADLQVLMAEVAKNTGKIAESSALLSRVRQNCPGHVPLSERMGLKPAVAVAQAVTIEVAPSDNVTVISMDMPDSDRGLTGQGEIRLKSRDGRIDRLLEKNIFIGREEGEIQIPWDASASRSHARIYMEDGQVWVEDTGSTNGTWINQHKVMDRLSLNRGDILLVGKTEFFLE